MRLTDGEYAIRVARLSPKVRGVTLIDADNFANIYINEYLSEEAMERTALHELRHIQSNDHYCCSNIGEIEKE